LNNIDGDSVGHLPLYRGKYVFYILKNNLYNFLCSATASRYLESFLNGENGNSYYFTGEDGYEIDGREERGNGTGAETGAEGVSW
jgi:hypothetical protein